MAMKDNEIIDLYFDRNEMAITATSEKYGNYCRTIAVNILNDTEDAAECVNDTYLKTWDSIPPHRPQMLRTFLGKITRNISFDLYKRKYAAKRGYGQIEAVLEELAECVSGGSEPEQELLRKELSSAINDFLSQLPKDKRIMFVSRYFFSDPVSEIAKKCGVSENTVSVNLNRLRKKLHSYLVERGFEL